MIKKIDLFTNTRNRDQDYENFSSSRLFYGETIKNDSVEELFPTESIHLSSEESRYEQMLLSSEFKKMHDDYDGYLELNPGILLDSIPLIDIISPRNMNEVQYELEESKEIEIGSFDEIIVNERFLPPSIPRENREFSLSSSTSEQGSEIFCESDMIDFFEKTAEFIPADQKDEEDVIGIQVIAPPPPPPPPQGPPAPPPPPFPMITLSSENNTGSDDEADEEVFFPVVGLRPARRSGTGFADLRTTVCSYLCSVPYKYQFKIEVSSAHPSFNFIEYDDFSVDLEGLRNRNKYAATPPKKNNQKRKRSKKKKKKKKRISRDDNDPRLRVKVKDGIKLDFYKQANTKKSKIFIFHIQFWKTSFHMNCKFQMILKYNMIDESGNEISDREIMRSDFFSLVARKKPLLDFRFWERFRSDDCDNVINNPRDIMFSMKPKKQRCEKRRRRRTGKKRKRKRTAIFLEPERGQNSYISMSNVIKGKRIRKKRKM